MGGGENCGREVGEEGSVVCYLLCVVYQHTRVAALQILRERAGALIRMENRCGDTSSSTRAARTYAMGVGVAWKPRAWVRAAVAILRAASIFCVALD